MIKYEELNNKQKANWLALIMAIDTIEDYCDGKTIEFDDVEVKQTAIRHFIEDTHIKIEEELDKMNEVTNKQNLNKLSTYSIISQLTNA